MKKILMAATIMVMVAACQHKIMPVKTTVNTPVNTPVGNKEVTRAGQTIILGHASPSIFTQAVCKPWYDKGYDSYTVDSATAKALQPVLKNVTVNIFLGSWCGDSKREVPRMLKVLQTAGVDTAKVSIVFVDNVLAAYKQSPGAEQQGKYIHRVPTFIFYEDGRETGRIVESPVVSLEKDMQAILMHQSYVPSYKGVDYWIHSVAAGDHFLGNTELRSLAATIKPLCKHYGEFNTYGYVQLAANNHSAALNAFRLNTMMYPEMPGVFDSLGEALEKTGDKKGAIRAYEKVLSLKPGDENALKKLAGLKGK